MEFVIELLVFVIIWGGLAISQTRDKKRSKNYYQSKALEHSLKGEYEQADIYIKALSKLK